MIIKLLVINHQLLQINEFAYRILLFRFQQLQTDFQYYFVFAYTI